MKAFVLAIAAVFLTIASASFVTAQTWNLTDSITGTQGTVSGSPTYSSGGFFSYDGVNDYFDTGIGVNYSSSWSFSLWAKNVNGSVCVDGSSPFGRAYDWRALTGSVCELMVNVQNATDQDNNHYNASLLWTNNTWRHVVWTYDATLNRSVVYVDGILRSNITQRGVVQISSSIPWRMGGNPSTGLYFNGSVANVSVWNTTLDQNNVTYLYNNNTPYCGDVQNWWAFAGTNVSCLTSTPSWGTYVNITISNTPIRTLPEDYRGFHTATLLGYPQYDTGGGIRNRSLQEAAWNSTKPKAARLDVDLANICQSYSGNPSAPCVWSTTNTSNVANINIHKTILAIVTAQGGKVHFVNDGPARWMATNDSKCTYGSHSPDFNWTSCDFYNNTLAANAYAQFFEEVGCTTTYNGSCLWEGRNEPYLCSSSGSLGACAGTFYYRNASVTCYERIDGQIAEWNGIYPVLKARLNETIEYAFPSMNYGYAACGPVMSMSLMGNFSNVSALAPDYANTHEYSSASYPDLIADVAAAQAGFTAGGYGNRWIITEGELNNDDINWYSPEVHTSRLMNASIYKLKNTSLQRDLFYTWSCYSNYTAGDTSCDSYIAWSIQNIFRSSAQVMNATKYIDDAAGTVYGCSVSGSTGVDCAYVWKNSTTGVLLISNNINSTLLIQTVSYQNASIVSTSSNTNGTTYTVFQDNATNVSLAAYAIDGYNISLTLSNVSYSIIEPNGSVNITEGDSIQFNVTVSNPSAYTLTYEWLIDGGNQTPCYNATTCTITTGSSSAGTYNITNKVYYDTNSITTSWILTVADSGSGGGSSSSTSACDEAANSFATIPSWFVIIITVIVGVFLILLVKGLVSVEQVTANWPYLVGGVIGLLLVAFAVVFAIAITTGVSTLC
jgi:hypothetical protein